MTGYLTMKITVKTIGPDVPRLPIEGIRENPLSRRLRALDNVDIRAPSLYLDMIYINTNENNVAETFQKLKQLSPIVEGCHIGFSGWHNFDIIAQRQSSRAVICDRNPENALFLYHVLIHLRKSVNRLDFIEKIINYVEKHGYPDAFIEKTDQTSINFFANASLDPMYEYCFSMADEITIELKRENSWLYSDVKYNHLKTLAMGDKIALITQDIRETDTFTKIKWLLINNNIQIDTLYLSNIADYMSGDVDKARFTQTLNTLLGDDTTIVIHAPNNDQVVTSAMELKAVNYGGLFLKFPQQMPSGENGNPPRNSWCGFFTKVGVCSAIIGLSVGLYAASSQ